MDRYFFKIAVINIIMKPVWIKQLVRETLTLVNGLLEALEGHVAEVAPSVEISPHIRRVRVQ